MLNVNLQLFGGRGANGINKEDAPNPGGDGNGNFAPNSLMADFQRPQDTLKESIGTKKRQDGYSINNSIQNANPFYNGGYADYSGT